MDFHHKVEIAKCLKNVSFDNAIDDDAIDDFIRLQNIDLEETSSLSRIGLKFMDFYTYIERLNTVGSKGISFYTFLNDFQEYYNNWPCIKRLYDKLQFKHSCNVKCAKEIFQLYFGSINAFRPVVAMKIYDRFKPTSILNVCSGWGGFLVGACAMNIPKITTIDSNFELDIPYQDMKTALSKYSCTEIDCIFNDALNVDFSKISYDMAICSPPYYNTEIYSFMHSYNYKFAWNILFYRPLFTKLCDHLEPGGTMVFNIPIEIYVNVLMPLLGDANEKILLSKYGRNNSYKEYNYVYFKPKD